MTKRDSDAPINFLENFFESFDQEILLRKDINFTIPPLVSKFIYRIRWNRFMHHQGEHFSLCPPTCLAAAALSADRKGE